MKKNIAVLSLLFSLSSAYSEMVTESLNDTQWQGAIVYSSFSSIGSGVPVSNCHILTNEHVVRSENQAYVMISNDQYEGDVVAIDKENDIALIKLDDCPIETYAKVSKFAPEKGEVLTSVYGKAGYNFFNRLTTSKGAFTGFSRALTNENRAVASMIIDDPHPPIGSSGGGVMSKNGLVSIIFSIASTAKKPETYGVDYFALRKFLKENGLGE